MTVVSRLFIKGLIVAGIAAVSAGSVAAQSVDVVLLTPTNPRGGAPVNGTVRLAEPAATSLTVVVRSDNPVADPDTGFSAQQDGRATLIFNAGEQQKTFIVRTFGVAANTTVTITAAVSSRNGKPVRSPGVNQNLILRPPAIASVTLTKDPIRPTSTASGQILFQGRSPKAGSPGAPLTIAATSSNPSRANVQNSPISVPSNSDGVGSFTYTSAIANSNTNVTFTFTLRSGTTVIDTFTTVLTVSPTAAP